MEQQDHRGSFCSQILVVLRARGSMSLFPCLAYDLMIKAFCRELIALLVCISTTSIVSGVLLKTGLFSTSPAHQ